MPMTLTQIESEAAKLNARQRAILIDRISATLPVDKDIENEWMEEAARRHESIVSGQCKAKDAKTVLRNIRKRLASAK